MVQINAFHFPICKCMKHAFCKEMFFRDIGSSWILVLLHLFCSSSCKWFCIGGLTRNDLTPVLGLVSWGNLWYRYTLTENRVYVLLLLMKRNVPRSTLKRVFFFQNLVDLNITHPVCANRYPLLDIPCWLQPNSNNPRNTERNTASLKYPIVNPFILSHQQFKFNV